MLEVLKLRSYGIFLLCSSSVLFCCVCTLAWHPNPEPTLKSGWKFRLKLRSDEEVALIRVGELTKPSAVK
jgi:hypothetical protein